MDLPTPAYHPPTTYQKKKSIIIELDKTDRKCVWLKATAEFGEASQESFWIFMPSVALVCAFLIL